MRNALKNLLITKNPHLLQAIKFFSTTSLPMPSKINYWSWRRNFSIINCLYIFFIVLPIYIYIYIYIYINRSARSWCSTRSIFKRSLTGLNSEFFFAFISCHTMLKEPSLPNYFLITRGRSVRFINFPRL